MKDFLFVILHYLISILLGLLTIELFSCICAFVYNLVLKDFAKEKHMIFKPGKYHIFSYGPPGKIYGIWGGYKIEISYSYLSTGVRSIGFGSLFITLYAENPTKRKLTIYKNNLFSKKKNHHYTNSKWDKKFSVESHPVQFAKAILKHEQIRYSIMRSQIGKSLMRPIVKIYRSGEINIVRTDTMITKKRIIQMLSLAEQLAMIMKDYHAQLSFTE